LVEHDRGGADRLFRYVIDCHRPGAVTPLAGVLRLPVLFTTHCVKEALFCLWSLGLPEPARVWDTWVAERAFRLRVHHPPSTTPAPSPPGTATSWRRRPPGPGQTRRSSGSAHCRLPVPAGACRTQEPRARPTAGGCWEPTPTTGRSPPSSSMASRRTRSRRPG